MRVNEDAVAAARRLRELEEAGRKLDRVMRVMDAYAACVDELFEALENRVSLTMKEKAAVVTRCQTRLALAAGLPAAEAEPPRCPPSVAASPTTTGSENA